MGNDALEHASRRIAIYDDDLAVVLEADGEKGAGLVDAKLTGYAAAGRELLQEGEGAGGLVDGEGDE